MKRILRWIWLLFAAAVIFAAAVAVLFMVLHSRSTGCRLKRDNPRLPVIYITTDGDIPWEGKTACEVAVVTAHDSLLYSGRIKNRGGTSSKYDKHSFSLKFDAAQSLCDLPANRSWILNASYIDKTFMRHKLCYDLFNMMGDYNAAPKCGYALVRHNGSKLGLYVVMQRLNNQVLQLNTDDTAAVIFKEPKIFYPEAQMPDPKGFGENYQGQSYPDFENSDRSYLMDAFRNFLTKTSDREFYAHVGEWIDIQNLVDYHLLLLFVNGGDNVKKNFYLYRVDSNTPYRIALWDCDHSFGRDCDNEKNMLERLLDVNQNVLIDRMLKSPEYNKKLHDRYCELRKSGIFSYENVEKLMRENDTWLRLGLAENTALWPFDSKNYYDAANYDEEYALILEFVKLSIQRLDKQFEFGNLPK